MADDQKPTLEELGLDEPFTPEVEPLPAPQTTTACGYCKSTIERSAILCPHCNKLLKPNHPLANDLKRKPEKSGGLSVGIIFPLGDE